MFSAVKEVISSAADGALHLMGLDSTNEEEKMAPALPEPEVVAKEPTKEGPPLPSEERTMDSEAKLEEEAKDKIEKILNEPPKEAPAPPVPEDDFCLSKWSTKQSRV
jgi:hypothetical protein